MLEALDAHVGLGRCLGLVDGDGVGDFEVQCCWTQPGNCEVIMTGKLSTISQLAIHSMKDLVHQSLPAIASRLNVAPGKDVGLM